jgi:hypothetical protein
LCFWYLVKTFDEYGVHQRDLAVLKLMVQELLNIEQFFQINSEKSKLNILGHCAKLLVLLESP